MHKHMACQLCACDVRAISICCTHISFNSKRRSTRIFTLQCKRRSMWHTRVDGTAIDLIKFSETTILTVLRSLQTQHEIGRSANWFLSIFAARLAIMFDNWFLELEFCPLLKFDSFANAERHTESCIRSIVFRSMRINGIQLISNFVYNKELVHCADDGNELEHEQWIGMGGRWGAELY